MGKYLKGAFYTGASENSRSSRRNKPINPSSTTGGEGGRGLLGISISGKKGSILGEKLLSLGGNQVDRLRKSK